MKNKLLLFLLISSPFLFANPVKKIVTGPSMASVLSSIYLDSNGNGFINAGDTIIYTFTVTNTGDVLIDNLSVTDALLTPSTFPANPTYIYPNTTATFSVNYTITSIDINTGSITNTATISGTTPTSTIITDVSDSDNSALLGDSDPTVTQLQTTLHPAVGLLMQGQFMDEFMVEYTFSIRNIGDDTLTDIYVSGLPINNSAYQSYPELNIVNIQNGNLPLVHIASLAPGQEDTYTFRGNNFQPCFNQNQAMVIATTSFGTKIADLSDQYSYYNNNPTQTIFQPYMNFNCDGVYQDTNGNSIVDVGDVVNYSYQLNFSDINNGMIFTLIDPNVAILNPNGYALPGWATTGVHTINQNDIDLGYVTNSPSLEFPQSPCPPLPFNIFFTDPTPCNNCPTPVNCLNNNNNCIITRISTLLPNLIGGAVTFNTNNDNCTTGIGYPNKLVTTTSGVNTYGTFTNYYGSYSLYIPNSGSFTTTATANLGSGLSSNPTSVTQVSSGENMNYPTSFCISSATNVNDLSVVLIPTDHARPGFTSNYRLHYENNGTTSLNGTIQLIYNNGKLSFYYSNYTPDATTANSLMYNFTNLLPYQYRDIYINFNIFTPPTVNQGDLLTFSTVGTTTLTDVNTDDNTFVLNQSVVNSFDPNDKTVLEGATITAAQATKPLHYITRFQNTGTFAAYTVVLKETLDADLDWNTFEPIGSSHNYRIRIINGNQVTITFDAINLINSSANESASNGWFAYKIKPKSTFAIGNIATSIADIYFDYNLPITTNPVTTQIAPLSNSEFDKANFRVYPNPANTYFVIESSFNESATYEIVAINGKTLSSGTIINLKPIDISELANGFYFVNIKNRDKKQTYKIVKQ